jgi:hypothetical protein
MQAFYFEELSDEAKKCALDWYRGGHEYFWSDEAMASFKGFVKYFGGRIENYQIDDYRGSFIKTDLDASCVRGIKLKSLPSTHEPTGYCLDFTLWDAFIKSFKASGSAWLAFNEALEAGISDVLSDIRYSLSDEALNEHIIINEYEFHEDGSRFYIRKAA